MSPNEPPRRQEPQSGSSLGFALIGCGKISRKHVHALERLPGARLLAVYDLDSARAEAVASGIPGARAARTLEEAFAMPGVDAVTVATPSGSHAAVAIAAARAGKHVVVEKPLALTLDEADEMIAVCDSAGVKLFVVKQNRYNRPVLAARRAVDEGRLGRIFMGGARVLWHRDDAYYQEARWRGTWAQDGGVCTNQASHHIDLLLWFMGEAVSVFATGTRVLHRIETEDTATVMLKFRHGATAVVQATTCTQPRDLEGSISLFGTRGTIEIGGFAADRLRTWTFADARPEDASVEAEWGTNPKEFAYNHGQFYEDVLRTIGSDRRALIDGIEGRKSLEVIHAIYESMETGREVALRFEPHRCRLGLPHIPEEG
ncbi:MAG: Gfo/Idh/MocA family oxidoreductase [Candidatus Eisenbacteria bacterium]|nr:Gfo/Idh/MocA family oxidoreductase [Candidatus Eisenbacteria bacterium]